MQTWFRCRAHGLEPSDIVKLTTYMVAGQDGERVRDARQNSSVRPR